MTAQSCVLGDGTLTAAIGDALRAPSTPTAPRGLTRQQLIPFADETVCPGGFHTGAL